MKKIRRIDAERRVWIEELKLNGLLITENFGSADGNHSK